MANSDHEAIKKAYLVDMLYADMKAGKLDSTGTWATHIKAVKDANPKPS